jgi:hypothetical protein
VNVHASKTEAGFRLLPMPEQLAAALMSRKEAVLPSLIKYHPERVVLVISPDNTCPAGFIEIDGKFYDVDGKIAV